jgi:hypothetical protein
MSHVVIAVIAQKAAGINGSNIGNSAGRIG